MAEVWSNHPIWGVTCASTWDFPQKLAPRRWTHNSPVVSRRVHTYSIQLRLVPVMCSRFKWYTHTYTHMLCNSVYIELKWCFYTVYVCVQGRGVSCPRQPPSCSPMVNICSSDSSLWGSGCGDVEEANLADLIRPFPSPQGHHPSDLWLLDPLPYTTTFLFPSVNALSITATARGKPHLFKTQLLTRRSLSPHWLKI